MNPLITVKASGCAERLLAAQPVLVGAARTVAPTAMAVRIPTFFNVPPESHS
jgi:hypothetical protein